MKRTKNALPRTLALVLATGGLGISCSQDVPSTPQQQPTLPPGQTTPLPPPFDPVAPQVYVGKVKNLVTGQAPTDAEVQAVAKDPAALRTLVDGWMKTPAFQAKMLAFFRNAFQQAQINPADLMDQLGTGDNLDNRLLQNIMDSFPLTAWQLAFVEGRPFTETLTTSRFMITPPLSAFLAAVDYRHFTDQGKLVDDIQAEDKTFNLTLSHTAGMIPLSQSLDPKSANYLHFYLPDPVAAGKCTDPVTYTDAYSLLRFLFGTVNGTKTCQGFSVPQVFDATEYSAWRMVSIRQPAPSERAMRFYDLPTLRGGNEFVLRIPRVGFFSTPAFFANWSTNASNQARVTMNQTLIVALNRSFDDHNNVVPMSEPALDAAHASDPACLACHKSLDPMRQVFRQAYTFSYHEQLDPAQTQLFGVFAVAGVTKPIASPKELGQALADHPLFAGAWTQKLCNWANSAPCSETDPEFQRVAGVFQQSHFNFRTLLLELLTSPLTTGSADTVTFADQGLTISVSRRDQLCAAMSARLGVLNLCAMGRAPGLSLIIPSDGYSRGSTEPVLATDPTLFFTAGTEQLCRTFADLAVDSKVNGQPGPYLSSAPGPAFADLVHTLMGVVASDPRAAMLQQVLSDHFQNANKVVGIGPTNALKSTFVLACSAPPSISIGL